MAILKIMTYPDPFLKKVCQPVGNSDIHPTEGASIDILSEYQKLASDMLETMYKASGIGLSAIQVGKLIRLLVIDIRSLYLNEENGHEFKVSDSRHSRLEQDMTHLEKQVDYPLIMFNPVITKRRDKASYKEGCLSLPGFFETVERSAYVEVKGFDKSGKAFEVKTDGVLSICLQHEIDHLDGKLFIDRLSFLKANVIRNQIKKQGYTINPSIQQQNENV